MNISWWGPGSVEDRAVPLVMDVMRAHDIRVAFHMEPYTTTRGARLADDLLYLIREYGERRRWDTFLLLEDASGVARPVFKLFLTHLPPTGTDCRGRVFPSRITPRTASIAVKSIPADRAARGFRSDRALRFAGRRAQRRQRLQRHRDVRYVHPPRLVAVAGGQFSAAELFFSFPINPGFDRYPDRPPFPECYSPSPVRAADRRQRLGHGCAR